MAAYNSHGMSQLLGSDLWRSEKLSWSMHDNPPDPRTAEVWCVYEDGKPCERPLTQAELESHAFSGGAWELHLDFDDRAIKDDSSSQLKQMVCRSQHPHHDSIATSSIQMLVPWRQQLSFGGSDASPWITAHSCSVQIKRVEVFEGEATVQEVLQRIAGSMCYGYFEGICNAWPARTAALAEGRAVFELHWGT